VSFFFLGGAFVMLSLRFWTEDKQTLLSENTERTAQMLDIYRESSLTENPARLSDMIRSQLLNTSAMLDADFVIVNSKGDIVGCRHTVPATYLPTKAQCSIHDSIHIPAEIAARALKSPLISLGTFGGAFTQQMLCAAHPVGESTSDLKAGLPEEPLFVLAIQDIRGGLADYIGGILRVYLIASLFVLFISFFVVYYTTFLLVRPLREMARATKMYANGNFAVRVQVDPKDSELRTLGEALNSMAVSLATLESQRRSFVANVSHELKTPMTSINGFLQGMLDGTIPKEQQPKYMRLVSEEVSRLSRLVTGMLNLSKIEAGELSVAHTALDLSELLVQTLLSFERIIEENRIEIQGLEDLRPITVQGDRDLLTQVFYNLIDNAAKFTPPGFAICFSTTVSEGKRSDRRRFVTVAIRNTGVGVPSDKLPRLFDRFYKADESRGYDAKSSGLGLYLVKTITELHGGKVTANSDGSSWTEFTVMLPLQS
jgi:signal transduction histidine kinase